MTRSYSREGALPERREPKFGRGGSGLVRVQKEKKDEAIENQTTDRAPPLSSGFRVYRLNL